MFHSRKISYNVAESVEDPRNWTSPKCLCHQFTSEKKSTVHGPRFEIHTILIRKKTFGFIRKHQFIEINCSEGKKKNVTLTSLSIHNYLQGVL